MEHACNYVVCKWSHATTNIATLNNYLVINIMIDELHSLVCNQILQVKNVVCNYFQLWMTFFSCKNSCKW